MALFFALQKIALLLLSFVCCKLFCMPFTVIMSDAGVPSGLLDGPQTGFTMNNKGDRTDSLEQEAVYDVMKATGNEWAADIPDVCHGRWHGIECMPDNNNVYHIVSLSFGALSEDTAFPTCDPTRSFLSPSITKLPHIRTLFFYRCFSNNPQPIPTFLGKLSSTLQTLVLRENGHIGPIPDELGNLTHIKVLDLHKNNLNGSIPSSLNRFTGLRSLDLSSNKLTGSIPPLNLTTLNVLELSQNHLVGSIPSSLGTCQSLIKIDFSRNHLTGPMPESLTSLKNLMLMDLSYNLLSGPFPVSIENLVSLQALIFNGNPMVSTTIPTKGFHGLKDLMILVLSDMNLEGPIPESLGHLPNLHVLHLDGNHLNGSIPESFSHLNHLNELRLNNNQLTGHVPFGRDMVWRMNRKLKLHNNSGLCYDASNGYGDALSSLFDSGIESCESQKPGSATMVQHLSTANGQRSRTVNRSDAAAAAVAISKSSLLVRLLKLAPFLFYFVRLF